MLIRLTPNEPVASMSHMKNIEVYEIVEGTRVTPGKVVKTFTSIESYKCGGPATACLRAWERLAYTRGKRNTVAVFFRKVA